jgi:hypothetical protein
MAGPYSHAAIGRQMGRAGHDLDQAGLGASPRSTEEILATLREAYKDTALIQN